MFSLSFVEAGEPGSHDRREGTTLIGRASTCDLIISAATISRQHARIRLEDGRVFVSDAGSTYGTIIGGERGPTVSIPKLVAPHPYEAFARAIELFHPTPRPPAGWWRWR